MVPRCECENKLSVGPDMDWQPVQAVSPALQIDPRNTIKIHDG